MRRDEWQLEMLCNIAASELLMPTGNLTIGSTSRLGIDELIELRKKFDVSIEAILLRVVRLERRNCVVFVASVSDAGHYRIDYAVESQGGAFNLRSGLVLPSGSRVADCTAAGYTAKGEETWVTGQTLQVECVAIPPYPGQNMPRVAGIAYRKGERATGASPEITFVTGDATKPHGKAQKIIAHVVNDGTARWGGGGFARVVGKTWPLVQKDFIEWAASDRRNLKLGRTRACRIEEDAVIFSMICQHGYGPSPRPRIRYQYLRSCLTDLQGMARDEGATVHMPRIGCGEAGGNWYIVEDLIRECLCDNGVEVTIYDLQSRRGPKSERVQASLFARL
jgi:hypothetical protein